MTCCISGYWRPSKSSVACLGLKVAGAASPGGWGVEVLYLECGQGDGHSLGPDSLVHPGVSPSGEAGLGCRTHLGVQPPAALGSQPMATPGTRGKLRPSSVGAEAGSLLSPAGPVRLGPVHRLSTQQGRRRGGRLGLGPPSWRLVQTLPHGREQAWAQSASGTRRRRRGEVTSGRVGENPLTSSVISAVSAWLPPDSSRARMPHLWVSGHVLLSPR